MSRAFPAADSSRLPVKALFHACLFNQTLLFVGCEPEFESAHSHHSLFAMPSLFDGLRILSGFGGLRTMRQIKGPIGMAPDI